MPPYDDEVQASLTDGLRDETERQVTVAIEYVENARTARDSDGVEPVPE